MITVGNERFRCVEAIFNPSLLGVSSVGLQDLVYGAVMKCDIDLRNYLLRNILLSGGNTMFPGLRERVTKEVTCLANTGVKVKVTAPPERSMSSWNGGSILASLSDFHKLCISKDEYASMDPQLYIESCSYLFIIIYCLSPNNRPGDCFFVVMIPRRLFKSAIRVTTRQSEKFAVLCLLFIITTSYSRNRYFLTPGFLSIGLFCLFVCFCPFSDVKITSFSRVILSSILY